MFIRGPAFIRTHSRMCYVGFHMMFKVMKKLVTVIVYVLVYVLFHLPTWTCHSYTICIHYLWSTIKKNHPEKWKKFLTRK